MPTSNEVREMRVQGAVDAALLAPVGLCLLLFTLVLWAGQTALAHPWNLVGLEVGVLSLKVLAFGLFGYALLHLSKNPSLGWTGKLLWLAGLCTGVGVWAYLIRHRVPVGAFPVDPKPVPPITRRPRDVWVQTAVDLATLAPFVGVLITAGFLFADLHTAPMLAAWTLGWSLVKITSTVCVLYVLVHLFTNPRLGRASKLCWMALMLSGFGIVLYVLTERRPMGT